MSPPCGLCSHPVDCAEGNEQCPHRRLTHRGKAKGPGMAAVNAGAAAFRVANALGK
eukprot:gene24724-55796_t